MNIQEASETAHASEKQIQLPPIPPEELARLHKKHGTEPPDAKQVKTEKPPSKRKASQARAAAPVSSPKSDSSPERALETFLKNWLSGAGSPAVIITGSITVGAILLGNGDVGGVGNVDGAKQNAAGCQTGDRVENNDSFGKEAA